MRVLYQISKHAVHRSLCLLSIVMLSFVCVVNTVAKNMQERHSQLDIAIFSNTLSLCRDNQGADSNGNTQSLSICDAVQESGIGGTGIDSEANTIAEYPAFLLKPFDRLAMNTSHNYTKNNF